jgi:hypothetical protein
MPLRYKSKGVPELPSDFRQVAEELLGRVDWQDTHSGFCKCPGEHLHTRSTGHRDCKVFIDDGVPTIHCFHDSCKDEVIAANFRLRSTIGKMTYRMNGHTGNMERPNRSAIEQRPFETFLKACFQPDDILSFAPGTILEGETRAIPNTAASTSSPAINGWNAPTPREVLDVSSRQGMAFTCASIRSRSNPMAVTKMWRPIAIRSSRATRFRRRSGTHPPRFRTAHRRFN